MSDQDKCPRCGGEVAYYQAMEFGYVGCKANEGACLLAKKSWTLSQWEELKAVFASADEGCPGAAHVTKPLLGFMDRLEPSTAVFDCDLERLMTEWRQQAWGIERTRGDGDPGAMALRGCCTDLAELILAYKERKKIVNNTAQQEAPK